MKTEEQSSTSVTPKIITPTKELVGVKKSEKKEVTKETTKLPQPTGWRMLVLPFKMDEKTKRWSFTWTRNNRETTSRITVR